jgi:hypothetical protein
MMRTLQFAAVGAFLICIRLQRIVAAAHVALGGCGFSFWDSHFGTCSVSNLNVAITHKAFGQHWQAAPESPAEFNMVRVSGAYSQF